MKLEDAINNKVDALIDMLQAEEMNDIEKERIKGMIQGLECVLRMKKYFKD